MAIGPTQDPILVEATDYKKIADAGSFALSAEGGGRIAIIIAAAKPAAGAPGHTLYGSDWFIMETTDAVWATALGSASAYVIVSQ